MLPFKNRLTKRKDIETVRKYGQAQFSGNIVLRVMESGLSQTRIGFAVGLSFSPRAVERNSMKRQLREILRQELSRIRPGLDVVIIARKRRGEKIKKEEIKKSVRSALERANVLTNQSN